jgi:hypothetical protein
MYRPLQLPPVDLALRAAARPRLALPPPVLALICHHLSSPPVILHAARTRLALGDARAHRLCRGHIRRSDVDELRCPQFIIHVDARTTSLWCTREDPVAPIRPLPSLHLAS